LGCEKEILLLGKDALGSFILQAAAYHFGSEDEAAALLDLSRTIAGGEYERLRNDVGYHELESLFHLIGEDCARLGRGLSLPDDLLNGWAAIYEREKVRSTLIQYGAVRALSALDEAGVRAIPLKGFYISRIYDRPGARGFRDLDLLVEPESLPGLNRALQDAGFEPHEGSPSFVPAPAFTVYYLPINGSDTGMEIDIHIGMHWPPEYFKRTAFNASELWSRTRPIELDGLNCWAMANEDFLITTLLDVAINHRYARLIKFRDLLELLRKDGVDWDYVSEISSDWAVRSFVAPGLEMLATLDPALVPAGAAASLLPSYVLIKLFERTLGIEDLPDHRSRSFALANLAFFLLGDSPRARLRGLAGLPYHMLRARH
jgi:Uncharacterised nucleotidyltransferase